MSGIQGSSSNYPKISELAKNTGTGATKLEKETIKNIGEKVEKFGEGIFDTVKQGLKSTEGKAIAAISIIAPGLLPVVAAGVVAETMVKKNHGEHKEKNINSALVTPIAVGVAVAAGADIAGLIAPIAISIAAGATASIVTTSIASHAEK